MLRVFVGIALPDDIRAALADLKVGMPGARWIPPENMHITVAFIGEIDEGAAEDAHEALGRIRVPAFATRLFEIGHFGDGNRARALWIGVERAEPLMRLNDKVETALSQEGIPVERRKYRPHVTLARLKNVPADRLGTFMAAHNTFTAGPFAVDRFVLFRSRLGGEGAAYEELESYPLDP